MYHEFSRLIKDTDIENWPAMASTIEWYEEFERRARKSITDAGEADPTDNELQEHAELKVDHEGTRRFIWRGVEKFHMRIDSNWREDG